MAIISNARVSIGAEARRLVVLPDWCGHVDCASAAGSGQTIGTTIPGATVHIAALACEFDVMQHYRHIRRAGAVGPMKTDPSFSLKRTKETTAD